MTTKEWLKRSTHLVKAADALASVNNSKEGDSMRTARQSKAQLTELYIMQSEIIGAVAELEDLRLRTILIDRYLNGLSWNAIAAKMGYSRRRIFELHADALAALESIRAQR